MNYQCVIRAFGVKITFKDEDDFPFWTFKNKQKKHSVQYCLWWTSPKM